MHHCHATGCRVEVPQRLFACNAHWMALPSEMRRAIWRAYVPGQERGLLSAVSREYAMAARAAVVWLAEKDGVVADVALYDTILGATA